MRRLLASVCAGLCLASLWAPSASAALISYAVTLNGPSESPPNASPGTGVGEIDVDPVAHTLRVIVSFSGLLGTTTASHIHCCTATPFTGTAGVATVTPTFPNFPLNVTSGTYDQTFITLLASTYNPAFVTANGGSVPTSESVLFAGLASDRAYLNIHTTVVPGGEIRGFPVRAVPEPATLALLSLGVAALAASRRRKQ